MTDQKHKEISRKLILEAVKKYRGLFNKAPSDDECELYADLLSAEFEFKQVTWALTQLIKKGSPFFPSCGEIFATLQVSEQKKEDLAPQIVAEMLSALREFSQYDEERMHASVSPLAKKAFLALGSTIDIRFSENVETVRAQLERLVKGIIASNEAESKIKLLESVGIKPLGINQALRKLELLELP